MEMTPEDVFADELAKIPQKLNLKCVTCGAAYVHASMFHRVLSPIPCTERLSTDKLCPDCLDIERTAREKEDKDRAREMRFMDWQRKVAPEYRETRIESLPPTAKANLPRVIEWKGPKGLILAGPTEQGKTRVLHLLIKRLWVDDGYEVKIFDCSSFNHEYLQAIQCGTLKQWASEIARVQILVFDDFGKMRLSDGCESELFTCIERRTSWRMPTLISTNDNGESLKARMSLERAEPLIRRLREFCELISFVPKAPIKV